ncbi:MAG: T9SS type A sorting domain-containing protein [Candidatus Eisenbacteria bacterium]|nr:T9SS type A sorting domain-containing protein [Candidatus Eisenbacteria bacterium]
MNRRIATVAVLGVVAVAATLFVLRSRDIRTTRTADEIAVEIAEKKTAAKADMAARGERYEPGAFPSEWASLQRAYPHNRINFEQLREARSEARIMEMETAGSRGGVWVERGPTNIGARVTDLAIHPTSTNIVYAAMASGGIFKSTDGGTTWDPIFDDQSVLTIGDIALDPVDPDIIYVGTGEANAASYSWFGEGMFKSTDGGATWSYVGLEETRYIGRVIVDPRDTDRLWVAGTGSLFGTDSNRGVYRSLDAGASWEKVFALTDSTAAIDLAIHPTHTDTIYAAMWERVRGLDYRRSGGPSSGVWRSYDGGDTWTELTNGLPTGSDVGRIGLAIAESSPNIIYAFYTDDPGYFMGVYKSTDGGDSWNPTNSSGMSNLTSNFGWYFGQVRVDPTDPTRAFVLGVPFYRTENGGFSWSEVGGGNHVDHHALEFDPFVPSRIYEGNDGGIYVSNNSGDSWTKRYDQPTNQFYAIEIDYQNPNRLYGGTQDNGTLRTVNGEPDTWQSIFGGDGFYVVVDPTDTGTIFCEYQWGNAYKSTDFGYSWSWALSGVDDYDRRNWSSPIVMDPSDPQTLYFGTYRLWRTTNQGDWWTAVSGDLTSGGSGTFGTITTIAVAPTNPDVLYVGTDDSHVWVTQNGGANWADVSSALPNRWVTRVAVDPIDPDVAYVTFSGLRWNENIGHVYRTDDAGASWSDITGNLPDAPVNALVVDPQYSDILYAGSDVGCFYTMDLGTTWSVVGTGLPAVPVFDLKLHQPTRTLVAGTHGRSIHSIDLNEVTGAPEGGDEVHAVASLSNHPNPFGQSTTVTYSLERPADVTLTVYDIAGHRVRSLESGRRTGGSHEIRWDGRNDSGRQVANGTYFLKLETGEQVKVSKVSVLR